MGMGDSEAFKRARPTGRGMFSELQLSGYGRCHRNTSDSQERLAHVLSRIQVRDDENFQQLRYTFAPRSWGPCRPTSCSR